MSGTGNNPRHPTRVPSQWAGVAALLEQHEIVVFDAANGGYDVANRRNREQALGMPVPQAIRTPTPTLLRLPLRLRLPLPLPLPLPPPLPLLLPQHIPKPIPIPLPLALFFTPTLIPIPTLTPRPLLLPLPPPLVSTSKLRQLLDMRSSLQRRTCL